MNATITDELMDAVSQLRLLFPDWRMGQLMANLLMASGAADGAAIWEVEDEQLLAAARRLINRNSGRVMTGAEPEAAPDRGGV
jgi:hypothetical protein